jgi:hypothetical protein
MDLAQELMQRHSLRYAQPEIIIGRFYSIVRSDAGRYFPEIEQGLEHRSNSPQRAQRLRRVKLFFILCADYSFNPGQLNGPETIERNTSKI